MIVFLASEIYGGLFDREGWILKTYIRWQTDVSDFIKTEYANLAAVRPEAVIVDQMAVSDWEDVLLFKRTFPEVEVILLAKDKEPAVLENCRVILTKKDADIICQIKEILYPEEKIEKEIQIPKLKIGILPEDSESESSETSVNTALHLLFCLSKYTKDLCLIEVSEESFLPVWAKRYGWGKSREGYDYQGIPLLHNAVMETKKISIFLFLSVNEKSQNMHSQCDIPLKVMKTDTDGIKLTLHDKVCKRKKIKHPFQDSDSAIYQELFGEWMGFFFDKHPKNEINEGLEKNREKEKKKTGNSSKWKKRGIFVFLLCSFFCFVTVLTVRLRADKKEKELSSAVQNQAESTKKSTDMEETVTQTGSTAKTSAKTKGTPAKKISSQTQRQNTTGSTRQKQSVRAAREKKTAARRKKTTTARRKKTTTAKKKKTTTKKKKPATTKTFDVDYKVE